MCWLRAWWHQTCTALRIWARTTRQQSCTAKFGSWRGRGADGHRRGDAARLRLAGTRLGEDCRGSAAEVRAISPGRSMLGRAGVVKRFSQTQEVRNKGENEGEALNGPHVHVDIDV